jgi:hypothetical protein
MANIGQPLRQWDVVPEGVPEQQPTTVPEVVPQKQDVPELVPV